MRIAGVLGLLFALVFMVMAFSSVMTLQANATTQATGALKSLIDVFPTLWMMLIALVSMVALVGTLVHFTRS